MAKKIGSNDLFEQEDIFKGIRDSADKTIAKMKKLKLDMQRTAKTIKTAFNNIKFDNSKGLKDLLKLAEKANKIKQQSVAIDKAQQTAMSQKTQAEIELLAIEKQRQQLAQEQLKTNRLKAQQDKRENAERKKKIKLAEQENNAYKKLAKNTRDLKNKSKELGAQMIALENAGKKNTKAYNDLAIKYKQVTKEAQKGDAQLKKLDKTVGDNFRNVGNYKNALAGLQRGLGALGLAFGIGSVVRAGVGAIVEFDQAVQDLSAITGAGGKDLQFYKEQAQEMGMEVEGGASAVIEAYKLIGSAKPELLSNARALNELTKSAILLSQASGLELPEASKQLTDAMNQFGASSEEASKFVDVLASGAKFGSAEIPQITEALLKFGAIAKSSAVSVQESTGAIELLAEKGIKGAEAGTKLRNVMLKLSAPDALPKKAKDMLAELGVNFEELSDKSKPFAERLKALKPALQSNTAMVKVFGAENVVAGQIMLENTERLEELTTQMDTNGVAQEQANKRTNTLGHALTQLKNAFTRLFTEIASGDGSMQMIINGLKWFAQNLPRIISITFKLVRAYVAYKVTLIAVNKIQYLYNGGLKNIAKQLLKNVKGTRAYKLEQIKLSRATKDSAQSTSQLGSSLKSLGLMAVIGLVTELAVRWYDVASGARNARMEAEAYAKAEVKASETVGKNTSYWREVEREELLEIQELLADKQITQERATELEIITKKQLANQFDNLTKQRESDLKIIETYTKRIEELQGKQKLRTITKAETKELIDLPDNLNTALITMGFDGGYDPGTLFWSNLVGEAGPAEQLLIKAKGAIEQVRLETEEYNKEATTYRNEQRELIIQQKTGNDQFTKYSGTLTDVDKKTKKYNSTLKDTNEYLSRQKQLLFDIEKIRQEKGIEEAERNIDTEFQKQLTNIAETGEFDATKLNELIEQKFVLEKKYIEDKRDFELQAIDDRIAQKEKKEFEALMKERDRLIANADNNQNIIDKINADFNKKDDELVEEQLKRRKDAELEKVVAKDQADKEILDLERGKNESIKENNKELTDEVSDYDNKKKDEDLEKDKIREQTKRDIAKATADYLIQQSQKRVKQIDEEIKRAQDQSNFLQDLAKNGNIKAEQSLAEQNKIIEEANRRKEQELKKQARIRLAESIYQTYSAKVEANVENPVAETIRDATLLQTFIASLPTFMEGTEDTGTNGRGIDGKGGFQAVLHPNERVIPKNLNDQIGSMSNEQLTNLAIEYQNRQLINGATQESSLELMLLVNEMQDLKQVIKDKPEFSAEVGAITQNAFEIVEKTKKNNTTIYNRFKVQA